jgi:tetratricopeptide (TPR) repeat protein
MSLPPSVRLPLRAAVLLFALGVLAGPGAAEPAVSVLDRAERLYQDDHLQEAERLFRQGLPDETVEGQRRCYERLLAIYVRLARLDQAIQLGRRYRDWLRDHNQPVREREVMADQGKWYYLLGHLREAEQHLEQALDDTGPPPRLAGKKRLQALTYLAQCAEQRGRHERTSRCWREVEEEALARLAERPAEGSRERAPIVWALADSYRYQKKHAPAIAQLKKLLPLHDDSEDWLGKRDTLRRLAAHQAADGDPRGAEASYLEALKLHDKYAPKDALTRGYLAHDLANLLEPQKDRAADAKEWLARAIASYNTVLHDGQAGQPGVAGAVSAFWKLQTIYERGTQFSRALKLATTQAEEWSGAFLIQPRLRTEQGSLELVQGAAARARPLLRTAVANLEQQEPPNLVELPRAFNNLAVAEVATGEADRAETAARKNQALYRRYELADDVLLAETHEVLGDCAALRGDYPLAIDRYRKGIEMCRRLGAAADPLQSNLLLDIALLLKGQGDLEEALRYCKEAEETFGRFASADDLGWAAFDAARVNLLLSEGKLTDVPDLSRHILTLCDKYEIRQGALVVTAHHGLGLHHLEAREVAAAEKELRTVLALQEEDKSPLRPRTLNYLGMAAEVDRRPAEGERLYRQAAALQKDNPRAFPATHYITLWRLAAVLDQKGERKEPRALLEEAMRVVETARLQTYGDGGQRAVFFAQFEPAYEQLLDRSLRDGDFDTAFVTAARGRSRGLLDQLQAAGVDPRVGLPGPRGKELLAQEAEGRRRLDALRARALLLPDNERDTDKARKLLADFDEARRAYGATWREILNLSPAYRAVPADDHSRDDLDALRTRLLGPKTVLLVYSIGRDRSHVLLRGERSVRPEAFELTVPADVDRGAGDAGRPGVEGGLRGTRGFGVASKRPAAPAAPAAAPAGPTVPLRRDVARALVDDYLERVSDPDFQPTRGFVVRPRDAKEAVPVQPLELLANVVVPAALRQRLRDLRPDTVVIVPDGPLHKLPLEALVVEAGARPRYLLDELPPTVYAPSVSMLVWLAKLPALEPQAPRSLLTVSNPAYRAKGLPLLPGTAEEARAIRRYFDPGLVKALEGEAATRPAVLAALPGRRFVHLAAHCFSDEHDYTSGVLALAPVPGGKGMPADEGFLSRGDICRLPLRDCELAILSACVTNVGPQAPLEAGATMAGEFLTAGARRVVASHWDVDDHATAALMEAFVAEFTAAARGGAKPSYAAALRQARLKVRARAEWDAPFYWAPFVLLGPPS